MLKSINIEKESYQKLEAKYNQKKMLINTLLKKNKQLEENYNSAKANSKIYENNFSNLKRKYQA